MCQAGLPLRDATAESRKFALAMCGVGDCFIDSHSSSRFGTGTVNGTDYDAKACYLKALERDPGHAKAWNNLGLVGGGAAVDR